MSRLPRLTGREVRALERAGFVEVRVRGSYHFLAHSEDPTRWATVPVHRGHILPTATLHSILKTAKLLVDELRKVL